MSKLLIFVFIVIIAVALRFFQLGNNPPSLDWDEASLGYNAYSILKTGADEYGDTLPIAIRSFDDFKPAMYAYLVVPAIAVFGLTEFAVRVPSAIFGVLAVVLTYFLIKELFVNRGSDADPKRRYNADHLALLVAFLLAISPWHLQFSRAAFEANIGLTFFMAGVLFLVKSFKEGKLFVLSMAMFVLSLYSYHSLRLVVPIFLLGVFIYKRNELWQAKKHVAIAVVIACVIALPLIASFLGQGQGTSRFSSVTTIQPTGTLDQSIAQMQFDIERNDFLGTLFHNRRIVYVLTGLKGYLDHWNFNFLFLTGDGVARHHAVDMGMLYVFELPFLLLGIYLLARTSGLARGVIFLWFMLAPVASAITSGTPHPVRALLMVVPLHIFTALGVIYAADVISKMKYQIAKIHIKYFIYSMSFLLFTFNFIYYLHQYYIHTSVETSQSWQYGYKQAAKLVLPLENKYDKILVTYKYDQPYIFFLFYQRIDPLWYQKNWNFRGDGTIARSERIYGKYEFRNINWGEDKHLENTLIIGTPEEIPKETHRRLQVDFLDGTVAFYLVER